MATDSVTAQILIDVLGTELWSAENLAGAVKNRARRDFALANGTSDGQCDLVWSDRRSLAAATSETLDLSGTALTDAAGTAIAFAQVDYIIVLNRNTTAGDDLHIGQNSSNGFTGPWADASDRAVCPAGSSAGAQDGLLFIGNPQGWAVTAGTGDLLYIENIDASNAISYDIIIIGRSA